MMQIPSRRPEAIAYVNGGADNPELTGMVHFYQTKAGVLLAALITGLPGSGFFAFHIHEGGDCGGEGFADTRGHYNPTSQPHPDHAGDLPPLLSNDGEASLAVVTNRFQIGDVLGKTVVIHREPDDFHTQPSGNSGEKIACGVIRSLP